MRNQRWSLVLIALLALVMAACGGEDEGSDSPTNADVPASNPSDATEAPALDLSGANNTGGVNFDDPFGPKEITLPAQALVAGQGALLIDIQMPDGYKLNKDAPFRAAFTVDGASVAVPDAWAAYTEVEPALPLTVPLTLSEGQATITGDLTIYWCEAVKEELCFIDTAVLTIPVTVAAETGASDIIAPVVLVPPVVN